MKTIETLIRRTSWAAVAIAGLSTPGLLRAQVSGPRQGPVTVEKMQRDRDVARQTGLLAVLVASDRGAVADLFGGGQSPLLEQAISDLSSATLAQAASAAGSLGTETRQSGDKAQAVGIGQLGTGASREVLRAMEPDLSQHAPARRIPLHIRTK